MKTNKGYYLIFGAVLTLAFFYLINDFVFRTYKEVSVASVVFWGWLGANIVLSPIFLGTKKARQKIKNEILFRWKLVLSVSVLTSIGGFLLFLSISESSSGVISLLEKSNIIFVFILGIIFLKEKITVKEIIPMLISIAGLFLITNLKGEISSLGVGAILLSQFLYAAQSFLIKKFGQKMDSFVFSFIRSVLMLLFIGIFFIILGQIEIIPLKVFIILTIAQVFGVFMSRYLFFEAHKFLPISKLGFLMLSESILTLAGAFIVFGDTVSMQKFIGGSLILAGLLFFLKEQYKEAESLRSP
jgi:drug/metabolite transporter (DMT)-like permease